MRKGGNSALLSPHFAPLGRICRSVFPFSPGSWHLLNAWCSEPLRNTVLNKQNKTSTSVLKQLPFQRGTDTAHSSGTQGESRDAGDLGEVPGVLPERLCTNAKEMRSRVCGFLILLVVLLVLPAEGTQAERSRGVSQGGKRRSRVSGAFGASIEVPLEALVPHAISRAGQVFICFTDLTSNTLFLPLSVSNLKLKPFHYFYIFQF